MLSLNRIRSCAESRAQETRNKIGGRTASHAELCWSNEVIFVPILYLFILPRPLHFVFLESDMGQLLSKR